MAEVTAPPGIDNLESWPAWFVGRETELTRLDAAATAGGPVVVAAVHGLGGVGKSSLAAYWAGTRDHGCTPIVWIRADSPAHVERGLAGFATRLQPALAEVLTVEDLAERGLQWLATHTGWLLILDNVEDPSDIAMVLARARTGRVLITGRLSMPWQHGATVISLDVLASAEAEQLLTGLITAAGPRDLDGMAELCAVLGYLPLAVEQAGAYLSHQRFTTPRAYLRMLNEQPRPTLDRAAAGTDPERTIARIWRITLDRIAEIEPAAVELLRVLAWYASDSIPLTLCHHPDESDQTGTDAALGALAAYDMVTPDPCTTALSIHRLVQAVARTPDPTDPHRIPEAIARAHTRAAKTLCARLPDWRNPATWSFWRTLLPHIDALTSHTITRGMRTTATIADIRNHTGAFLAEQGLHASALTYLHQAIADFERILGPDHPNTLTSRHNLAYAYKSAGQIQEAIPLLERTLTDHERILGPDHPNTLTSRNNLAYTYESAGQVQEAIPLFERTLTEQERALGPDHPGTLVSRHNLASAYESAGRLVEAIPLYERIFTDIERAAMACESAGRVDDALPLYERVLTDRERVLGPDHPHTLDSRHNLAHTYRSMGRVEEALPLYERLLTDHERVLGEDHPDTLTSRNNLAYTYTSAGQVQNAIVLFERTLTDRERVLGPDHPHTLVSRHNLAHIYQAVGRLDEALPLFERTLTDRERILGPDHPSTVVVRYNLAVVREQRASQ